jgi:drug/metabolite transporter (DMT)-like permease
VASTSPMGLDQGKGLALVHHEKTWLGLLGILGICLTAGLALPFVNVLTMFTPEQLMVVRGFLTAAIALIALRGTLGHVDKYTYLIALTGPFAVLGLFHGIRHLGAGPAIIIVTATPLVNFAIGLFSRRRLSAVTIIAFLLVLGGVVMARWGGTFNWTGFLWIVFGTILNGILYELFNRASAQPLQKCFWAAIGMGTLGLVLSTNASWPSVTDLKLIAYVVGFAFVGGFLYWFANVIAFANLPVNEASVLAQGETLFVLVGAMIFLGEHLTLVQWIGVAIALLGTGYLSWSETPSARPSRTFDAR